MGFLTELRRRNVIRVSASYLVLGWLLLQLATTLESILDLPEWFDAVSLSALVILFPVVIILTWAFELTPEGVKVTTGSGPDGPRRSLAIADYALLILVVFVGGLITYDLTSRDQAEPVDESETASQPRELVSRSGNTKDLTIAVMPFVNMSNDPANAFFAEGISEEILNALTRIGGLRVVARTSSFALRGSDITVPEIGERLRADLVLEGSVRKAGNTVRVTAQLIETIAGNHLWSEVYERQLDDLFGVQDDVTQEIAGALPGLIGIEGLSAPTPRTTASLDPRAYQLILQARFEDNQAFKQIEVGDLEAADYHVNRANNMLDQALEIAPDYAPALVAKAGIVRRVLINQQGVDEVTALQQTQPYLDRALELDPNEASALGIKAETASRYEWRWRNASILFQRALAANPELADLHTDYAYHLSKIGRNVEALEHARIGAQLDPAISWRKAAEPRIMIGLGRLDEAGDIMSRLLRERTTNYFFLQDLYLLHLQTRNAEGMRNYRTIIAAGDWSDNLAQRERKENWLARADAAIAMLEGDPEQLIALVDGLLAEHDAEVAGGRAVDLRYDSLWVWAVEYAWSGQSEKAVELLLRAMEAEVIYLPHNFPLGNIQFPEPVSRDPRFQAVWRDDSRLAELYNLRLEALKKRQFAGVLPDGTVVTPAL